MLPAQELLAEMLLELGCHEEALAAYKATLDRSPKRLNSLYGAGRAAERAGEKSEAASFYRELLKSTAENALSIEQVRHARSFLDEEVSSGN